MMNTELSSAVFSRSKCHRATSCSSCLSMGLVSNFDTKSLLQQQR